MIAHDVSNWDGMLTQARLAEWKANGVGLVIPQAINPPAGYPPGVTRQQLEACAQARIPTDVYVWVWTHSSVDADIAAKLTLLNGLEALVGRLWLDCEDTAGATVEARMSAVLRALVLMDQWSAVHDKPRPGIYTGRWFWTGYFGNAQACSDRDLWDAYYDDHEVVDENKLGTDVIVPFDGYGGWDARAIKQFKGSPLDTNVLSEAEASRVLLGSVPNPEPTVAEFRQALAYLSHDVVSPLRSYKYPRVKAAVAEVERVAKQYGGVA